jgi:hypothetical protein
MVVCLDGFYNQRLVPRLPVFIQRQLDIFSPSLFTFRSHFAAIHHH